MLWVKIIGAEYALVATDEIKSGYMATSGELPPIIFAGLGG